MDAICAELYRIQSGIDQMMEARGRAHAALIVYCYDKCGAVIDALKTMQARIKMEEAQRGGVSDERDTDVS